MINNTNSRIFALTGLVRGESRLPESALSLTIPVDVVATNIVMGTETSGLALHNVESAPTISVGDDQNHYHCQLSQLTLF